jgi:hypothetical protein
MEAIDGPTAAATWADTYGDDLVREAIAHGALDWNRHDHPWGVVFEFEFLDEVDWDHFRDALTVRTAIDAAPDPLHGLMLYRGRGGSAGTWEIRRPRPLTGSGAVALPVPVETVDEDFSRGRMNERALIPA